VYSDQTSYVHSHTVWLTAKYSTNKRKIKELVFFTEPESGL